GFVEKVTSPDGIAAIVSGFQAFLSVLQGIVKAVSYIADTTLSIAAHTRELTGGSTPEDQLRLRRERIAARAAFIANEPESQRAGYINTEAGQLGLDADTFGNLVGVYKDRGIKAGNALVEGVKVGLDAHSPSRKLMALGDNAAEGFAMGME